MLLVMQNLPNHIKYSDIKTLICNTCHIDDIILDKLSKDGINSKKVTIGVAKEDDAISILRRLNGTYVEGQKIFIEEVKKNRSDVSAKRNSGMDYPNQNQSQTATSYQMNNAIAWNSQMYQYGYSMPIQTGANMDQDKNQQAMSTQMAGYTGYNATAMYGAANNNGIPPLMQSSYLAYGNQQVPHQLIPSQDLFGGSGPDAQQIGAPSDMGYNARSQNRGYDSSSIQKGFSSQHSGNYREYDSRGHPSDSSQDTRDYGSRNTSARFESNAKRESRYGDQNQRGFDSQESWSNDRGFSQGDRTRDTGDRKRRHSPDRSERDRFQSQGYGGNIRGFEGPDSRGKGFGGNQGGNETNSRNKRFGGREFESDSHEKGFGNKHGRGFDSDVRGKGFGGSQGRGFDNDSREKGFGNKQGRGFDSDVRGKGFGGSQGRGFDNDSREKGFGNKQGRGFDSDVRGKGFGGSQGRGFDSDSREKGFGNRQNRGSETDRSKAFGGNQGNSFGGQDNYNRGVSRDSYSKQPPKPHEPLLKPNEPYSWLKTSSTAKPSVNKPSANNKLYDPASPTKLLDLPVFQSSPVMPPEKRAKIDDTKSFASYDKKTLNKAETWRSMGISNIANSIRDRFVHVDDKHKFGKKVYQQSIRSLKKALNGQLSDIIKQKHPKNPYPLLQTHQIVELYRSVHPECEDVKLFKAHFAPPPVKPKPQYEPPQTKTMGPPRTTTVQQAKPFNKPTLSVKPKPQYEPPPKKTMGPPRTTNVQQGKTSNKPTLSDLLPPTVRHIQNTYNITARQLRQKPAKKPKPVDLEKRARQERKILHKTEFLDESLYKCETPVMERALNAVLDEITNVYISAVEEFETTDKEEMVVGQGVINKTSKEFRSTVRLHTIKRILNETSTLMLRVFMNGGRAPKTEVERVLQPYGITYLKASKISKTHMLTACVDSFENYDTLCSHTGVPCNGRDGTTYVTAKPLHLTIPMKFRRLLRQRKLNDDDGDEVDFEDHSDDDDVELPGDDVELPGDDVELPGDDVKLPGDDVELPGDDVELPGDDDDDVIEVIKEADVIEISGDEIAKPEDDTISEKFDESELSVHNSEDFTANVDDKISAEIDQEMGDDVVEIDEEEIREDDLEDY